ncbi:latent-transforming growth factor beta-binding protein 2-like [Narcine bancroftii]|uniref:latent-transforming growth factor beta-binding protein 2-like n=1 Tax=Narcine bancroftii TaxID=1343680 RepID=UPI0038313B4D
MERSGLEICMSLMLVLGLCAVPSESQRFPWRPAQVWGLQTGRGFSNVTASGLRLPGRSATQRRGPDTSPVSFRMPADLLVRAASQSRENEAPASRESSTRSGVSGPMASGLGRAAPSPLRYHPVAGRTSRPITSRIRAVSTRERNRTRLGTAQGERRPPAWPKHAGSSERSSGLISDARHSPVSVQGKSPVSALVSPARTRFLASGAPRTRLTAAASQTRSRQVVRQTQGRRTATRRLMGPNVCRKRCCPGWTVSRSVNRCIKPVCDPPCQNRGSCSRPQVCVCRSGFQGSRCEEIVPEKPYIPRTLSSRSYPSRSSASYSNVIQQTHSNAKNNTRRMNEISARDRTPSVGQSVRHLPQTKYGQHVNTQQLTGTSRMVKHLSNGNGQLLSNSLFTSNGQTQARFATNGRVIAENKNALPRGANLSVNVGAIKIIFTPTICKRQCRNGNCYNNCKKGDPTTLYSENGYGPVSKSGFRIYFCQIPCLNGGYCIGRDQCLCLSNSTGKFCHLSVPREKQRVTKTIAAGSTNKESVYTLPLSNQPVVMHPSLVNIHVNHPPEATVQIHQVARVKTPPADSSPSSAKKILKNSPGQQSIHSVQQRSQPHAGGNNNGQALPHRRPLTVGRCFQETSDGQCGKPLPGLTKQDDCCGSIGLSWGYHKCTKCPPKPAHPKVLNGQIECPVGYKKMNETNCQDINECLMSGMCQNANCLNTRGSYRCTCNPGYMLDTARSHCISDKAVSMELGPCFRSVSSGNCSLPLSRQIAKQICCCSRVGKGWGKNCDKCPLPGSVVFNEICPAGHGYHYSRSHVQILTRPAEEEEIARVSLEQHLDNGPNIVKDRKLTLKEDTYVSLDGYETSLKTPKPFVVSHVPSVDTYPVEVEVKTSPPRLVQVVPESTPGQVASVFATETSVLNICEVSPNICGPGLCISQQVGYTCNCDAGYRLDNHQKKCVDVNECEQANLCHGHRCINVPGSYRCECEGGYELTSLGQCSDKNECLTSGICANGKCINMDGSYRCTCNQGFEPTTDQKSCRDIDECLSWDVCYNGLCENTESSYRCSTCNPGYRISGSGQACEDINECLSHDMCFNGLCTNTEGSYRCSSCNPGYRVSGNGQVCEDIDECVSSAVCLNGLCVNIEGSYRCSNCKPGYRLSDNSQACEDVNECLNKDICGPNGECMNNEGSYFCLCASGFSSGPNGTSCHDINECLTKDICGPNGECINNEGGSYHCLCAQGYSTTPDGTGCEDVDECSEEINCSGGQCINTDGSYICRCNTGFAHLPEAEQCVDIDECSLYASPLCGSWECENTIGSYQCIMGCQPGFQRTAIGECIDIDECVNGTICGTHSYCENRDGSFRCLCDQGFEVPPGGQQCVDINECEKMDGVCGAALCENVEGSFFCVCLNENEEFDPATGHCLSHGAMAIKHAGVMTATSELSTVPASAEGDRKECYYNVNADNFCDNLLARNISKEGCCCTVGVGWGDNCEVHACPVANSEEYNEICPDGKGFIPFHIGSFSFGSQNYGDADECAMFSSEVCKNGRCVNTVGSYSCYCDVGFYYDNVRLECIDIDECQDEKMCVNGECVNTPGSFNCFCSPPLTLDVTRERCINGSEFGADLSEAEDTHLDICWQGVTEDYVCTKPLWTRSTYTECCCMYGEAWGLECAFCPARTSDDFAQLCNVPRIFGDGSTGLRDRSGYEFGREIPSLGEDSQPGIGTYDNYLRPEYGPYDSQYGVEYGLGDRYFGPRYGQRNLQPDSGFELGDPRLTPQYGPTDSQRRPEYGSRGYSRVPLYHPQEPLSIPLFSGSDNDRYSSFEGLQAEECGILNGCENGRCVRVQEGYTCDCFDGFELDMTKMTCVDISECEDISDTVPLCLNGNCENTEGSYKCICLPGYVLSENGNGCKLETEAGHQ